MRTFGAFLLGLVVGVVGLAAVLGLTGALRNPREWAWRRPLLRRAAARKSVAPPAPPDAGSLPDLNAAPKEPPITPPSELPQDLSASAKSEPAPSGNSGAATDHASQAADHPLVPVSGVTPSQLRNTFQGARDGRQHDALDIPAPRGTPVMAAVEGNVAKLFHSNQGGLTVYEFDDSRKYCYYYAHLDRYAPGLKDGTLLRKGQVLGYVGASGDAPSNAPHLHFAIFRLGPDKSWWKGTAVDPLPLLRQ